MAIYPHRQIFHPVKKKKEIISLECKWGVRSLYSVAVSILSQNTLQSRPADCYSRYLETMNFGQYMLAWFNVSKVIVFGWEKDFVYNLKVLLKWLLWPNHTNFIR